MQVCAGCNQEKKLHARGLCNTCYKREQRSGVPTKLTFIGDLNSVFEKLQVSEADRQTVAKILIPYASKTVAEVMGGTIERDIPTGQETGHPTGTSQRDKKRDIPLGQETGHPETVPSETKKGQPSGTNKREPEFEIDKPSRPTPSQEMALYNRIRDVEYMSPEEYQRRLKRTAGYTELLKWVESAEAELKPKTLSTAA